MGANVGSDGCLKVGDGFENAVSDGPSGQDREEILESVELRSGCWGEMVRPTRIVRQPLQKLRMLVRGVVVDHGVDHLSGRNGALDAIGAVPGLRVLSRSKPSAPSSAERRCRRQTAGRLTPAWRATSNTGNRSSESNTIFARCTRLRGVVAIADYPLGAFDVEALGGTQTVWAIRQARTSDRICESYVWLSALGRI